MALYVFGIGGTGARVIKALTMLMASGVQLQHAATVVPVLIDPDNDNGDLTRTLELLRLYRSIQRHNGTESSRFFFNSISSLADAEGHATANEYHFPISGISNNRFKDLIELNAMSRPTQALTQLLFSEHNLDADMQVGFKGNPNIGSVVLNRFKASDTFRSFANAFNADDRIVIIGSIFGGTGAAGLPLLIKNLRDADPSLPKHELLKNAPIAAISVLPYFNVQGETTIDGDTFISKTKAALTYYAANLCRNQSLNALYYLGDTQTSMHKGADGAAAQRNKAHFIELAAALAVVDFMRYGSHELQVEKGKALSPKYFEYGLREATNEIQLRHLGRQSFDTAGKSLSQYFLFQKFFRDFYEQMPSNTAWMKNGNHKLSPDALDPRMINDLNRFNDAFDEWLSEMEQSVTAFKPFRREAGEKDMLNTIIGFGEQSSLLGFMSPKGLDKFIQVLNRNEAKLAATDGSEHKLLSLFQAATAEIIKEHIKL